MALLKMTYLKTFIWNWETYCNTCIIRRLKLEIPRLWTTIYFKLSSSRKSNIKVVKINFKVGKSNFKVGKSNFKVENSEIKVCVSNFKAEKIYFKVGNSNFQVGILKEKNFNIALIRFHRIPFKYVFFSRFASSVEVELYNIFFNSKIVNNEVIIKRTWIKDLPLLTWPGLAFVVLTWINLCPIDID